MQPTKKLILALCSTFTLHLGFATEGINSFNTPLLTDTNAPWFTGPLLAPAVHTIPKGHYDLEPYLFFWSFTGGYNENWHVQSAESNFYSLQFLAPAWAGITSFLDVTVQLQGFYQFTKDKRSVQFGDIPFGVDIQLLNEQPGTWWPAIKLGLKAVGPTGKYSNLDPEKLGTDAVGTGSWQPSAVLALGRLFQISENNFLSPRFVFSYTVATPAHVKNYSVYGGTQGTHGTAYLGNSYYFDLGLEYNMNRNWVLACDIYYQHNNKTRFSGHTGYLEPGVPAIVTKPSSEQISLAPALEYNWSPNIGLIGGVWFTVAGRNSARFVTGTVAFNVYI